MAPTFRLLLFDYVFVFRDGTLIMLCWLPANTLQLSCRPDLCDQNFFYLRKDFIIWEDLAANSELVLQNVYLLECPTKGFQIYGITVGGVHDVPTTIVCTFLRNKNLVAFS